MSTSGRAGSMQLSGVSFESFGTKRIRSALGKLSFSGTSRFVMPETVDRSGQEASPPPVTDDHTSTLGRRLGVLQARRG